MPTFKKITKEHLTLDFKKLRKEQQTKPRVSRKKEIIKIGEEINEIENKKSTRKNINKSKSCFLIKDQ